MGTPPRKPWWLGLAIAGVGATWVYQGSTLPQLGGYAALGPGFFVSAVGAVLMLLGVLLLVQIARGETFSPQQAEDAATEAGASWPALLWAAAGAALPLLTMKPLGFPLSAMGSFALVTRAFGSRRVLFDCAVGLALGAICWLGFSRLGVDLGGAFPLVGW